MRTGICLIAHWQFTLWALCQHDNSPFAKFTASFMEVNTMELQIRDFAFIRDRIENTPVLTVASKDREAKDERWVFNTMTVSEAKALKEFLSDFLKENEP